MRWKNSVKIIWKGNCILQLDEREVEVAQEWCYLVKALECGLIDNELQKYLVMEQEQCDEVSAECSLAQFVLLYGFFLEQDYECQII